jgi:hypothetical protein
MFLTCKYCDPVLSLDCDEDTFDELEFSSTLLPTTLPAS